MRVAWNKRPIGLLHQQTLKAGDHVICSRSVFGSTLNLFGKEFAKFGVETTFVSQTDVGEWKRALKPNTKLLFAETDRYPELARFYYDEIHEQNQKLIRRAFEQGVAHGEFRPLDSASFALVAIAPILFASIWRHSFGRVVEYAVDTDAYFRTTIDILFSGIQATHSPELAHG